MLMVLRISNLTSIFITYSNGREILSVIGV